MSRRGSAWVLGTVAALLPSLTLTIAPAATAATAIARENHRPGTPHWHSPDAPGRSIEGYGSQLSVTAGQWLDLHVSTAGRYRVEVYRLGWYGGAGARLEVCEPSCRGSRRGRVRKMPAPSRLPGEVVAGWPVTDRVRTRSDWTTGEYMAQLKFVGGPNNGLGELVPFVVRSARPNPASILVEVPVNTWEAYNGWGGKSLYAFNSSHGSPRSRCRFSGRSTTTTPTPPGHRRLRLSGRRLGQVTVRGERPGRAIPARRPERPGRIA